jgi:hypothetical protein
MPPAAADDDDDAQVWPRAAPLEKLDERKGGGGAVDEDEDEEEPVIQDSGSASLTGPAKAATDDEPHARRNASTLRSISALLPDLTHLSRRARTEGSASRRGDEGTEEEGAE